MRLAPLVMQPSRSFFWGASKPLPLSTPEIVPEGTAIQDLIVAPKLQAITQIGDMHSLGGLCGNSPTGWVESLLELVHVSSGCPWWVSIVLSTVALRLILLPVSIKTARINALMRNASPEMEAAKREMAVAKAASDKVKQYEAATKLRGIFAKHKMSVLSPFWGLVQIPVLFSAFFAVRNVASFPVPGMETGGALWFTDLSAADPTCLLPIVSAVAIAGSIRLLTMLGGSPASPQAGMMANVALVMSIVSLPLLWNLPAATFVYMIASSILTALQTLLLNTKALRKLCGIAEIDKTIETNLKPVRITAVHPIDLKQAANFIKATTQQLHSIQTNK